MLKLKEAEFNLIKCQSAKMELELRVLKLKEDIERNEAHIKLQEDLEIKHRAKIKEIMEE